MFAAVENDGTRLLEGGDTGFNATLGGGYGQTGTHYEFGNMFACWNTQVDDVYSYCRLSLVVYSNGVVDYLAWEWNANPGKSRVPIRLCRDV